MNKITAFFKDLFSHFSNSNTFQEGAALAYYTVFSILPIIMITVSIFGMIWGADAVSGEVHQQLKEVLGNEAALQIQDVIKAQHVHHKSTSTAIIGFLTLLLGASGMFNQLHVAFNNIWNIKAKPKSSIAAYLSRHSVSISILLILLFLLLLSLTVNSFLVRYADHLSTQFSLGIILEHLVSLLVLAIMFALMFRFIGDAKVSWNLSLLSGLFTSVLFLIGKTAIGLYIGHSHLSSTYGSASAFILIMVWVYYTSQIIFLGASFAYVLGERRGTAIIPDDNAVKIKETELEDSVE